MHPLPTCADRESFSADMGRAKLPRCWCLKPLSAHKSCLSSKMLFISDVSPLWLDRLAGGEGWSATAFQFVGDFVSGHGGNFLLSDSAGVPSFRMLVTVLPFRRPDQDNQTCPEQHTSNVLVSKTKELLLNDIPQSALQRAHSVKHPKRSKMSLKEGKGHLRLMYHETRKRYLAFPVRCKNFIIGFRPPQHPAPISMDLRTSVTSKSWIVVWCSVKKKRLNKIIVSGEKDGNLSTLFSVSLCLGDLWCLRTFIEQKSSAKKGSNPDRNLSVWFPELWSQYQGQRQFAFDVMRWLFGGY